MKKNMVVGIALVLGMVSIGVVSASASDSVSNPEKCADKQAYQQFTQDTAELISALKAKNSELRAQDGYGGIEHGYDGIDFDKISELEVERNELKARINVAAQKHGIPACCRN